MKKSKLDTLLDEIDYAYLNSSEYVPSDFALQFMNFILLVNGDMGESHKTPPFHLSMLDKLSSQKKRILNLCFRGASKTTLMMEYLTLYLAVFGELPYLGKVYGMLYIADSMEKGAKNARKNIEFRYDNSDFLKKYIKQAKFTDEEMTFTNVNGKKLGVKLFGIKTGLRGTKIFGKRPTLAIMDDLMSDDDAKSATVLGAIKDIVFRGVTYALDPSNHKIILSGTPFNIKDIMVEGVESGNWDVNVYPVCESFPCEREDFKGAWEDRFSYDYVREQYETALRNGDVGGFYQELMLRISDEDNRLVKDSDIRWYSLQSLLKRKHDYNYYITTDFSVSGKKTSDFSVISVWAYNANGDWFYVDGVCKKQTMNKTVDDLFILVQRWKPIGVGVEVSGQQGAIVSWLLQEQINRGIWFTLASNASSGEAGIRPRGDKLTRFNLVLPWFKTGKFYFPHELKSRDEFNVCMSQLQLVTSNGIKGHDDFIDTVSMLAEMRAWKPSSVVELRKSSDESDIWEHTFDTTVSSRLSGYIV